MSVYLNICLCNTERKIGLGFHYKVFITHISACPFKIILGGVPVRVAIPPQLEAYATQVANVLAMARNSGSARFSSSLFSSFLLAPTLVL